MGLVLMKRKLRFSFFIIFVGVNITFFPQHFLGINGIPRRYSDYPDAYIFWNVISSLGSLISLFAVMYFLMLIWEGIIMKNSNFRVYYVGRSLEWINNVPPMNHTFNQLNMLRDYCQCGGRYIFKMRRLL